MADCGELINRLGYNANECIYTTHNTSNNSHYFCAESMDQYQLILLLSEMTEEIASLKNQLRNVRPYVDF